MKDHNIDCSSSMEDMLASIRRRGSIARRSVLVSIAGLMVASCGSKTTSAASTSAASLTASATPSLSARGDTTQTASANSVGKTLLVYKGHGKNVKAVGWSPDGKYIASAGYDGGVHVWEADTGKLVRVYRDHTTRVGTLAWSPDGKYLVSGGGDTDQKEKNTVLVWKPDTGKTLVSYTHHTDAITNVAWSSEGAYIISTSYDGTVQIWNSSSGKNVLTLTVLRTSDVVLPVGGLAVSPDSQYIVAGIADVNGTDQRPVRVYQRQTGKEILTYHDTLSGAQALSWSSDGRSIAKSQGQKIQIWDAFSGKDITNLPAINAEVLALSWSPDGKYLASGGGSTQAVMADNQAQVWDMTRKKVTSYAGHSAPISSISWSPDGTRIASASWDGTVQIWQAK